MLPSYTVVKKTAKTALAGSWTQAVIVACVFVFTALAQSLATGVLFSVTNVALAGLFSTLFTLFITVPLFLGVIGYFRSLAFGEKQSPGYVFRPFSDKKQYGRAFMLSLHLLLRLYGCIIIFNLPAEAARMLSVNSTYTAFGSSMPVWAPGLAIFSVLLRVAGIALVIAFMLRYYMAPFLFVANEDISAYEAIRRSRIIGRGRLSDFCWLAISMTLWILLSLLVMPLIFTLPYFCMSYIVHCRFCVANYNAYADGRSGEAPSFSPAMPQNGNERLG